MADETINPNVVLTANNTQYDQAMTSSASTTQTLATSVDTLTDKISSLTKTAAKFSFGIAAADIATITAATAAWGAYENQMSRLNAQAAITTRTQTAQTKTMQEYTKAVGALRSSYGTSTQESTQLVDNIAKLTENRNIRNLTDMSKIFVDMSKATGESSTGLANSVIGLQKVMGTSISSSTTRKYADQITYLSQQTTMSASGLADFAAQIAPVGRMLDLNQTQITGVATAFAKAGQDGFNAANAFSKIVSDIAYATQSGSPDLAKYANLVGVSVEHFNKLSGSEKILEIFDRLNSMGPRAITELNRLGLDGVKTMRSITAMTNQTGGLRSGIAEATEGLNSNASDKGAQASMKGMVDELQKIRSELTQTAEVFGSKFGPAITKALQGVEALSSEFRKMMQGPLGDVAAAVAGIGGSLALAAGSLAAMAGPLSAVATAALLWRGSGMMGLRQGYRGSQGTIAPGESIVAGGRAASWAQRYQYNAMNRVGGAVRTSSDMVGGFFGTSGRGPLGQRMGAGALNATAWGLRNLASPIYSPLGFAGYNDPARRSRLFTDTRSPWRQTRDAFTERYTGRSAAPSPGSQSVAPGTSLFDRDMRIAEDGTVTSSAARTAATARTAAVREAGMLGAAFGNVTRAAGSLAGAMASAATNTAYLATRGAGKLAASVLPNTTMLGIGAMMGASALGVQSNAVNFGATGLMFGATAGAVGMGAGYGMDIYQQHKNYNEAQDAYARALKGGSLTDQYSAGLGITDEAAKVRGLSQRNTGWTHALPVVGSYIGGYSPSQLLQQSQYGLEGIFSGSNPIMDRLNAGEKVERHNQSVASAFSAISSRQGNPIKGFNFDDEASWTKLDAVLQQITPAMEKLGITSEDVVKTWDEATKTGDTSGWMKLLDQIATPGAYTGLWDRIKATNPSGSQFINSQAVQSALALPENANLQYQALNQQVAGSLNSGMSLRQIIRQRGNVLSTVADPSSPEYTLNQAVIQQARQGLGYQMPFMSRTQGYQTQANLFVDQAKLSAGDPQQQQQMAEAQDQFMQSTMSQVQYFQQLLTQQREFNISMSRAQEDFGIQRERMDEQYHISRARAEEDFGIMQKQQNYDYHLSRTRAEEDYTLARERGAESYYRSMRRGESDFQLSRRRQEVDHDHQVKLMVQQQAQQMYNIYDRVQVNRTSSASYLVVNAQDQLRRMREQSSNLDTVRQAGLSDDAIQQLGFTDSANAQQLSRFVAEVASDPNLIKQMNQAIKARMKAAKDLVTDESSSEWKEFTRQYELSRDRAMNDFERAVRRSHKDFKIQMSQMEEDFKKSMLRQSDDYATAQERQQDAFALSMKRAGEDYAIATDQMTEDFGKSMNRAQDDLERSANAITGTMHDLLVRATEQLTGTSQKQAEKVLGTFTDLKKRLGTKGVDIMTYMADIFGFKYSGPGGGGSAGGVNMGTPGVAGSGQGQKDAPGFAGGGVLPGYTPGVDVHHFVSKTGGSLALSGGEGIMVPEWVAAQGGPAAIAKMNAEARYGRRGGNHDGCMHFAGGGTYDPDKRVYMDGEPLSAIAKAQILLAESLNNTNYRVMQGGFQPYSWYSGSSHEWPGVVDLSPGDFATQGQTRQVGFASWGRNFRGAATAGSGAHVHAVSRIDPGNWDQPQLSSFARGEDGLGGPDYGPNPPMLPNLLKRLDQFMGLAIYGGDSAGGQRGGMGIGRLNAYLKNSYPEIEHASDKVRLGGGLFKSGSWSHRMNKMARSAYHKSMGDEVDNWYGNGSVFTGAQTIGIGEKGPEAVIPLNDRGADFMSNLMRKSSVGSAGRAVATAGFAQPMVAHTIHSYQIDRSTTFSGSITVQANNPNELIAKLRDRQRVQALSQASMGGSRS